MTCVVVDIDDTLISTQKRVQAAWRLVLGRDIPLETVETHSSRQVLESYAPADQAVWRRFWNVLLCSEKSGLKLLDLDEPVPHASNVLQKWSKQTAIIYLTGRPEDTRELTLSELEKFGFPVETDRLMMFDAEDWDNFTSVESLTGARTRVFSLISKQYSIGKVIDDYPNFFKTYRQFNVPDRIGLLRPKRFSPQDYLNQGATRVVESWSQFLNAP